MEPRVLFPSSLDLGMRRWRQNLGAFSHSIFQMSVIRLLIAFISFRPQENSGTRHDWIVKVMFVLVLLFFNGGRLTLSLVLMDSGWPSPRERRRTACGTRYLSITKHTLIYYSML